MARQKPHPASRVTAGVTFAARLSFENISHAFSPNAGTLRDVTLSAEPGEVLCLLGPSGSGKTTLLRIAAGIESQTTGRVLMNDREIAGPSVFLPPEKRSIGLVFQDFALFPHLTILDNVRFGLTALSREESRREAMIALSRVGLEDYAASYPHVLSGGEQQRVALARALAPRPSVLLMDEPFSGLDSRLKDSVRAETLDILRHSRATAIVVTHDAEEAMRMGDRIALLKNGRLVQVGKAEELYQRPVDLFAAGFFSELNVFETKSQRRHGGYAARRGGRPGAGRRCRGDGCRAHGGLRCERGGGRNSRPRPFTPLSWRCGTARSGSTRLRNAGQGTGEVRRFVRRSTRYLPVAQEVRCACV